MCELWVDKSWSAEWIFQHVQGKIYWKEYELEKWSRDCSSKWPDWASSTWRRPSQSVSTRWMRRGGTWLTTSPGLERRQLLAMCSHFFQPWPIWEMRRGTLHCIWPSEGAPHVFLHLASSYLYLRRWSTSQMRMVVLPCISQPGQRLCTYFGLIAFLEFTSILKVWRS